MLQHPVQGWKETQGGKGVAGRRKAVDILAAKAESMGPLPRAELAHRVIIKPESLGMGNLGTALDDSEATAVKFRERSRPLLDGGDGKLPGLGVLSESGAVGNEDSEQRAKRKRQSQRTQGQNQRRLKQGQGQRESPDNEMAHLGAELNMVNPGAKPDSGLEEAPERRLPGVITLGARSGQADNIGAPSEPRAPARSPALVAGGPTNESCDPSPATMAGEPSNEVRTRATSARSPVTMTDGPTNESRTPTARESCSSRTCTEDSDRDDKVAALGWHEPSDYDSEREAEKDAPCTLSGLAPPLLDAGEPVTGADKERHRIENKRRRQQRQSVQPPLSYWAEHEGKFNIPTPMQAPSTHKGSMCPSGLALHHPAAELLLDYASGGCPAKTGRQWTIEEMHAAVARGPHVSALDPDAISYMKGEIDQKVAAGQVRVVEWDAIKDDPPPELKISPVALIPHKSRDYRAILDLSFSLRLESGNMIPSVNEASHKTAPRGAIDQMGHALKRIIYAMAEADLAGDEKVFMAKWDIKDGFWRLDCRDGEEWNFAYVLPQKEGEPTRLVVPTSLQMGWIESPPYFCTASETARDVAQQYVEQEVGTMPNHKFLPHTTTSKEYANLPTTNKAGEGGLNYMVEVYVDDFISLARATSQAQLDHVANSVMTGVHDVFPADAVDTNDPLSLKKLLKEEGMWDIVKNILGFTFDGERKAMWLEEDKRDAIITVVHGWIRHARYRGGIPFEEFESVVAKVRHAFTAIPAGNALLSPCNRMLRVRPNFVYLHRNQELLDALVDIRSFLRESIAIPTLCRELVPGHPDYIGVKDASGHGVGGIIVGENMPCPPTVFRMPFSQDIKDDLVSFKNRKGRITNSDLEFAGLLLLWIIMEDVCKLGATPGCHVGLYSDNTPTVHWVQKLASRSSKVAMQLLRCLAFRLKIVKASPLTPLHVAGVRNALTDIPSRSFGSEPKWFCKNDAQLLTLFNKTFPLPNQASWQVYRPSKEQCTRVTSVLQMRRTTADEWQRPPKPGKVFGATGNDMSRLWDWTLSWRWLPTTTGSGPSQASPRESELDSLVEGERYKAAQYQASFHPLARRSQWPQEPTPQRSTDRTSMHRA